MRDPGVRGVAALRHVLAGNRWLQATLPIALLLVVAACDAGGDDTVTTPATNAPDTTQATNVPVTSALECETAGYPCALDEVPEDIFIRSDMLSEEALDRIGEGASTEEAAVWLEGQEDMAEVDWDEHAIRFRLDGGRGTWVLRSSALATRGAVGDLGAAQGDAGDLTYFDAPEPAMKPGTAPPTRVSDHVVGPEDPAKSALVLSPMLWDFRETDDGSAVAALLGDTRGYEGRVDFEYNENTYGTDVDVEDFAGWDQYDVVHVVSHGTRLCKKDAPTTCRAVIAARAIRGSGPDGDEFAVKNLQTVNSRGLELATVEPPALDLPCSGKASDIPGCLEIKLLFLTADWFRDRYRSGLDDTVVFFNACSTYGAEGTDLADVLRASTNVYLGWTRVVPSPMAYDAAIDLYTRLQKGYPLRTAYDFLGPVTVEPLPSRLAFGARPAGGDLRIRDVVTLVDPVSGTPLPPGAGVAIRGEFDDDEPDAMPYRIWVDGIPDEVAGDVVLHLEVDGEEMEPLPLDGSNAVDEHRRELEGDFDLGEDLKEPRDVQVRAWIDLPSGGRSEQASPVTLTGQGPPSGRVWEVDIEYSHLSRYDGVDPIETSAHVVFELKPTARLDPARIVYEVTGGSVTHDQSHEDRFCIVEAPTINADVTPENAGWSALTFDTTTDPWGVALQVDIDLPDYVSMVACLPGTGEDAGPRRDPVERPESGILKLVLMAAYEGYTIAPGATTLSGTYDDATLTLRRVE